MRLNFVTNTNNTVLLTTKTKKSPNNKNVERAFITWNVTPL